MRDPEEKRRKDRERAQARRPKPNADRGAFGRWLKRVVSTSDLGEGAWSSRLAENMQEGEEYDRVLRKIADGATAFPRLETTWKIGEGLRDSGLLWCSGAMALTKNPARKLDYVALLDVCGKFAPRPLLVAWHSFVLAEQLSVEHCDQRSLEICQDVLKRLTADLWPIFDQGVKHLEKPDVREAVGLLGIAFRVSSDRFCGPARDQAFALLVGEWARLDPEHTAPQMLHIIETAKHIINSHDTDARPPQNLEAAVKGVWKEK